MPVPSQVGLIARLITRWMVGSALVLAGCTNTSISSAEQQAQAAKKAEEDAEFKAAMERRKKEREAKQAAEADEKAAFEARLAALAVLPDTMPKDAAGTCKKVGEAYDTFMRNVLEGDDLAKWQDAAQAQIPKTISDCMKSGSIEVAACELYALTHAPADMKEDVTSLIRACLDRYGSQVPGSKAPPKPK